MDVFGDLPEDKITPESIPRLHIFFLTNQTQLHPTYHMKKDNVEIICIEGNVLESKPTVVYLPDNVCMITDQNTAPWNTMHIHTRSNWQKENK